MHRTLLPWIAGLATATMVFGAGERFPWARVDSWGFQLQEADPEDLARSPFRLLVIDPSRDGTDSGALDRAEVETLRASLPGGRRLLAYLSIGEAEDYRGYWQPRWKKEPPPWLGAVNPDWPGNYKVKYWDPDWRALLHASLDRILAAGFDGVYLDVIDAYEYHEERDVADAGDRMKKLVADLAAYARGKVGSDFGVFPQNAEELLRDPDYVTTITGIGREETYYGWRGDDGAPTPEPERQEIERHLARARQAGKLVLTIDYTTDGEQMEKAHHRAQKHHFVEYCGVRALDRLIEQPR